jgi:hypothetical protein
MAREAGANRADAVTRDGRLEEVTVAKDNLRDIELRCQEILRSPYSFRELPAELKRLQAVMAMANQLAREDVPYLLSEIRLLRAQLAQLQKQPR